MAGIGRNRPQYIIGKCIIGRKWQERERERERVLLGTIFHNGVVSGAE